MAALEAQPRQERALAIADLEENPGESRGEQLWGADSQLQATLVATREARWQAMASEVEARGQAATAEVMAHDQMDQVDQARADEAHRIAGEARSKAAITTARALQLLLSHADDHQGAHDLASKIESQAGQAGMEFLSMPLLRSYIDRVYRVGPPAPMRAVGEAAMRRLEGHSG